MKALKKERVNAVKDLNSIMEVFLSLGSLCQLETNKHCTGSLSGCQIMIVHLFVFQFDLHVRVTLCELLNS